MRPSPNLLNTLLDSDDHCTCTLQQDPLDRTHEQEQVPEVTRATKNHLHGANNNGRLAKSGFRSDRWENWPREQYAQVSNDNPLLSVPNNLSVRANETCLSPVTRNERDHNSAPITYSCSPPHRHATSRPRVVFSRNTPS